MNTFCSSERDKQLEFDVKAPYAADAARIVAGKLGCTVRDSHHVQALQRGVIYKYKGRTYVQGHAKIEHAKHQHKTARVKGGFWRVQEGVKAHVWGFSRPTAD